MIEITIGLLTSYFVPHSCMGLSCFCMLYGTETTMELDLVIGEVCWQWPEVHCPNEYVEWLCASIRTVHTISKANLKSLPDSRREAMVKLVTPLNSKG